MNDVSEMMKISQLLSKSQIRKQCKKHGQCKTCGTKCFEKRLFKIIPLTVNDEVLEGRCLRCYPLTASPHTSQKKKTLMKSGRLSRRYRRMGMLFRTHCSDTSSFSGKSESATYYRTSKSISRSVTSVVDTAIPTEIAYQEFATEEQEEGDVGNSSFSGKSDSATCYRASKSISKSVVSVVDTAIPAQITYQDFLIEEEEEDGSNSSTSSGNSESAICNHAHKSSSTSAVSVANTAIPTHITYCELFVIGEEEEEDVSSKLVPIPVNTKSKRPTNSAIYNQTIEFAAELQSQQDYRVQKSTGAEVGHEQEILSSCTSLTYNSILLTSGPGGRSQTQKQDRKYLYCKDLEVIKYICLRAREQSVQLYEHIDYQLQNMRILSSPAQPVTMQPIIEKHTNPATFNVDDSLILSKMEEQTCTYKGVLGIATFRPFRLQVQQRAIYHLAQFDLNKSKHSFTLNMDSFK